MARRFEPRYVVDARVLEMLVCPLTKTRLTLSEDHEELISVAARLAFPIRLGVPMLSIDEAREIDPEELQRISALAVLAAVDPAEPPAEA